MNTFNLAFKALNDSTRREILELLRKGEKNAGQIAENFEMTAPSISHHLEILKRAGLIENQRNGQFILYSLNTTVLDEIIQWMLQLNQLNKSNEK